jgi:hypothetical protein
MGGQSTSVELPILPTRLQGGEGSSCEVVCTEEWVELPIDGKAWKLTQKWRCHLCQALFACCIL